MSVPQIGSKVRRYKELAGFKLTDKTLVSTRTLSTIIGLTTERIRQLVEEGIFEEESDKEHKNRKRFDLVPTVQTYIEYLKAQAKPSGDMSSDEARKIKADADWKEARAAIEQLHLKEIEGTMHRSEDVEAVINDLVMAVRAQVLALPGTLAVDCANASTPGEVTGLIKTAVNDLLNGLVDYEYNSQDFRALVREREDWLNAEEEESE